MIFRFTLAAGLFFLATQASADEWPRFRGPNGSGLGQARLPIPWTAKDLNWKIKLPGRGHSSPVVWGKQLYVTCADDKTGQRLLLCVQADTGKIGWQRDFGGEKHRKHEDNSFAAATPCTDDKHVYLSWGNAKEYLVVALDHDGKESWRRDLGPFLAGHGFGVSPIVHEDLLIAANDQNGPSSLVALDRHSGDIRWQVPRKSKATYSTPCVYQPKDGPAQLLFTNYEHGVTSIDPDSGKVNWELDIFDKGHLETAIGSPIVSHNMILASCGWLAIRQEVIAVQLPVPGKEAAQKLYSLHQSAPLCTSPLVKDDLLFLWSDQGVVTCASVENGEVFWKKRVAGSYYSSPVCFGNHLLNVSRDGEVVVLAASKKYQPLAQHQLDEGTHATPALAHDRLYIRTFSSLISLGGMGAK